MAAEMVTRKLSKSFSVPPINRPPLPTPSLSSQLCLVSCFLPGAQQYIQMSITDMDFQGLLYFFLQLFSYSSPVLFRQPGGNEYNITGALSYSFVVRKHRPWRELPYWPLELGRILGCSAWILILKSLTEIPLSWLASENWQQQLWSQQWYQAPDALTATHQSLHCEPSLCSGEWALQEELILQ